MKVIWKTVPSRIATTGTWCFFSTLLMAMEKGRPRSRAKAYREREPSASKVLAQAMSMTVMSVARMSEATSELVESR